MMMDVEAPRRAVREVVTNIEEEEDEEVVKEKKEQERSVVEKLSAPCLKEIEDALTEGK